MLLNYKPVTLLHNLKSFIKPCLVPVARDLFGAHLLLSGLSVIDTAKSTPLYVQYMHLRDI